MSCLLPSVFFSVALTVSTSHAYTCTGFDPVQSKQNTYPFFGSRHNISTSSPPTPSNSIPDLDLLNHGARRLLSTKPPHTHHSQHHDHDHSHHSHSSGRRLRDASSSSVSTINSFRLDKVSLTQGSLFAAKQAIDLQYITWLDPDSILYNFRNTSNLPIGNATPFGGWEDPDCLLRGHFSGHWLSASAMMYNATGNETVLAHAQYVVSELAKCQEANADVSPAPGYLSGFPAQQFTDLENLVPYPKQWSPYYTIHKIMAGLRDQYLFTGNVQALQILENMASYFRVRIDAVITQNTIAKWYAIMNQEFGGMNEVLTDLYSITGNSTYLETAHLFDKPCWLGPLTLGADQLDSMHANAHIPIVIGAAARYMTLGDKEAASYADAATSFRDILVKSHSYATGNGNQGEYWGLPNRLGDSLATNGDTQETCSSYNVLKLEKMIFSWDGDVEKVDHYERLLTNGILSTQNPHTFGSMIYMLPISTVNGTTKGWGDPIYSMTCCYGTGIENFAKIADSLYYHEDATSAPSGVDTLYVVQYQPSTVIWDTSKTLGTITLQQSALWSDAEDDSNNINKAGILYSNITITGSMSSSSSFSATISLRIPSWIDPSSTTSSITVNGKPFATTITPLSWVNITLSTWSVGDVISVMFPFAPLRTEMINDDRPQYNTTGAILTGPFMLTSPTVSGSSLYGNPASLSWIQPITQQQKTSTTSFAAGGAGSPNMYMRHDTSGSMNMSVSVASIDVMSYTDAPDSTFMLVSPGLAGAAASGAASAASAASTVSSSTTTASIGSVNYPNFYLCYNQGGEGSAFTVSNYDDSASFNSSCTFTVHSPGLTGVAGTISLEVLTVPNTFVSWYNTGNAAVTAQALIPGNENFANRTTWTPSTANWPFPAFSFIAHADSAARAAGPSGARDFLLFPIHEVVTEAYVSYFQIAPY